MTAESVKVCNWILANKLALNIDKTAYLLLSGKKLVITTNQFYMFISAICKKNDTKFLGLIIEDKLSWKSHNNKFIAKFLI